MRTPKNGMWLEPFATIKDLEDARSLASNHGLGMAITELDLPDWPASGVSTRLDRPQKSPLEPSPSFAGQIKQRPTPHMIGGEIGEQAKRSTESESRHRLGSLASANERSTSLSLKRAYLPSLTLGIRFIRSSVRTQDSGTFR
jgi:hypothetical protein